MQKNSISSFKTSKMMTFWILVSTFGHFYIFHMWSTKSFSISCPNWNIWCNNFNSKIAILHWYGWFFKIQMKPFLVSDQFQWNWSETKIKCTVSVKLGTKKRAFLAKNWLKEQFHNFYKIGFFGFIFFSPVSRETVLLVNF